MELYNNIREIIDAYITYCLIPLIASIIFIEVLFKNTFKSKQVLNLVRWFIILYTFITLSHFIIGLVLFPEESAFLNRATGPYRITYWIMLLSASMLPFTLLYKKLASNTFYLLFIAFAIKIGWYFERFVIIVSSYHRDYSPGEPISNWFTFPIGIFLTIVHGLILALLLLGFFELIERSRHTKFLSARK